ncbi:hypothetical protein MRX96_034455 [Rhipicephalus microplus]
MSRLQPPFSHNRKARGRALRRGASGVRALWMQRWEQSSAARFSTRAARRTRAWRMGARGGAEWFAADPPPYINRITAAQMPAATRKKGRHAGESVATSSQLGKTHAVDLFTASTHRSAKRKGSR